MRQQVEIVVRPVMRVYVELVLRHSERFRAFAALPLLHIEESIAEMDRALNELEMVRVAMNTTVLGRALIEPDYAPIFAEP